MSDMRRVIRKATPVELIAACMDNEGVRPVEGQSRTAWLNANYVVTVDTRKGVYIATKR
jgi:hypothetical protein